MRFECDRAGAQESLFDGAFDVPARPFPLACSARHALGQVAGELFDVDEPNDLYAQDGSFLLSKMCSNVSLSRFSSLINDPACRLSTPSIGKISYKGVGGSIPPVIREPRILH